MAKVFSYIRFSSGKQARGSSVERQRDLADKWLAVHPEHTYDPMCLPDLAKSAFKGANLDPKTGELGKFLWLAANDKKRVPAGSILLLERLDRFTRADALLAVNVLSGLIINGITVITLQPSERIADRKTGGKMEILFPMVMDLIIAHEYSAKLSDYASSAYSANRKKAIDGKRVITSRCPSWLKLSGQNEDSKWQIVPARVAMVKQTHKMAQKGYGMNAIAAKLNADGHLPTTGRSKVWTASSIRHLLRTRTLLGELVCSDGTTIKGYYPAILTEAEYYSTQKAVSDRFSQRGRRGKYCSNLFQGFLWMDGQKGWVQTCRPYKGKYRYTNLIPAGAMSGAAPYIAFPYQTFENSILHHIKEITADDLAPQPDDSEVIQLEGELAKLEARMAEAEEETKNDPDFKAMARVLKGLEEKHQTTAAQLEKVRQARSTPELVAIHEAQSLAWALEKVPEDEREETRSSLRQRLRGLISRIEVSITVHNRYTKTADCLVTYRSGTERKVTIEHNAKSAFAVSESGGDNYVDLNKKGKRLFDGVAADMKTAGLDPTKTPKPKTRKAR